jgi:predicted PurR-regulated permease PerM
VAELTKGRGPLGFLESRYQVVERLRAATAGDTTLAHGASSALSAVRGVATSLVGLVAIAFLTLFMLLEGPEWRRRLVELVPGEGRASVERVGAGVYRCVAGFVTGNLAASLLAALVATVTALVAHVPYALPLGLFVGIADLVPIVGPVVATLVVASVAFTRGAGAGVTVLVVLTAYHLVEGHTLRPLLYGRGVALSPLTVLVSLLLCSEVLGLLRALAAIPIAGTVSVVIRELLERRAE